MPFCNACGNEVLDSTEICPKCGSRIKGSSKKNGSDERPVTSYGVTVTEEKSSGIAAILGLFIAGGGVMYAGDVKKGIILLIATYLTIWFVVGLIPYFYAIYLGYQMCEENNKLWREYNN